MDDEAQSHTDIPPTPGYEKRDVNVRLAFGVGAVIILVIAISVVILNDVFVLDKEEIMFNAALKPESMALREFQDRETETLTTYKTLDGTKGVYRIPVSRAMELMADEAYQAREAKAATKQ